MVDCEAVPSTQSFRAAKRNCARSPSSRNRAMAPNILSQGTPLISSAMGDRLHVVARRATYAQPGPAATDPVEATDVLGDGRRGVGAQGGRVGDAQRAALLSGVR